MCIKKNTILCKHVTISSTMRKKTQEIFIRDDLSRVKVDIQILTCNHILGKHQNMIKFLSVSNGEKIECSIVQLCLKKINP